MEFVVFFGKAARFMSKLRFKMLRLATIKDLSTEEFKGLRSRLATSGWKQTGEYCGFDAWIDYGCVNLKKNGVLLKLEWDNWTEGSVEGPRQIIAALARENGWEVTHEWRWSEYDEK